MSPTPSTTPPDLDTPDTDLYVWPSLGDGPPLVLAHGFTQTGRVWGAMDTHLAADHRVIAVDMPGHGRSSAVAASLPQGAELLGRTGGRAAYLGYSMGARFCLHLALAHPELVDALVLISGTAGIDEPEERAARRRADETLAEQLDPGSGPAGGSPTGAVTIETFLRGWMENPMFDGIDPEAAGFAARMANTGPGLASSLRSAGTGTQLPLWGRLGRLQMPVLVITGARDQKFTALGARLVEAIGHNATQVVVPDTGHAPHLQQPGEVASVVRAHLVADPPG
jgi:2-succinyl-6-hydroxy-2,4-cyclohexadiene-1-carboxylate synthase